MQPLQHMKNGGFMNYFLRGLLLLGSAYLTACTTPAYFAIPNQRFDSPTVSGKLWKGNVGAASTHPTYIVTVKDVDATPPDSSGSGFTRDPGNFDFLDRINIDIRLGLGSQFEIANVGDLLHLKYQFAGSSRLEHKPDEFVGAVTLDYLGIHNNRCGDCDNKGVADFSIDGNGLGASLILGYRTEEPFIYYANLNYIDFDAKTDVDQTATAGSKYSYKGSGRQVGAALGARYEQEKGFYAAIEWAYSKTSWTGLKESELGSYGFVLGHAW